MTAEATRHEFQALKRARYVDAHDALTDPRTAGYVETYVKPLRITSMLDTVIEVSGRHLGLLCFEHVDQPHQWQQDEVSFAGHLADKLALALISKVRRQAEELLRASEARFRSIYNSVSDAILAHDIVTGGILDVNARATEMFGYSREQFFAGGVGMLSTGAHPYTQAEALRRMSSTAVAGSQSFDWHFKARDGRTFWGEVSLRRAEFGTSDVVLATVRDISERKRQEEELRESESRFRAVSETAQDAIIMADATGKVVYWNPASTRILGYSPAEAMGRDVHGLLAPPRFHDKAKAGMAGFAVTGRGEAVGKTLELAATRKDGVEIPVELSIASIRLGAKWHGVAILRDITERKEAEKRIRSMARRDFLTDLANRAEFVDRLEQEIARAERNGTSFAILYLDLDHFKDVNDTLGHPVGDSLLQAVGQRLTAVVREADTVARFGGDEFAIIEVDTRDPSDAAVLADKVLKTLSEPFSIHDNKIHIGASIGIDVYGPDRSTAETLLTHADVALYRAKSEGRGSYRFFTDEMDGEVRTRVTLVKELREGMTRGEFFLMYQPQVEIETGRIKTLEALVRWRHPTRGLVPPADFVEAAEKSGLIVPLGNWILREACRQTKEWLDSGWAPPRIAVNLSAVQFKTPSAFEHEIEEILAQTALPPEFLELELTESVLMSSSTEHRDVLLRLRDKGLSIAMDDFGTGYSSLSYLSEFPIDLIKIAQTFMLDLRVKSSNAAIVRAAIGLANELGLQVVVEGVETAEQLKMITRWGGRIVQGYYFSKPVAAAEVPALLGQRMIAPPR